MAPRATATSFHSSEDVASLQGSMHWNGSVVTYSFPQEAIAYGSAYGVDREPERGFLGLGEREQEAVHRAFERWSAVADIRFLEKESGGVIRFGYSKEAAIAHAYLPSSSEAGGDVWLGHDFIGLAGEFEDGSYEFFVLMHEIGHALGLKHPHDRDGSGVQLDAEQDWLGLSLMSYRAFPGDSLGGGYDASIYPETPMQLDIEAITDLYGSRSDVAAGDDLYRFDTRAAIFRTIHDAAGHDTIVIEGEQSVAIDLRPGRWSDVGKDYRAGGERLKETLALSRSTLIEDATGGSGHDRIKGNDAANRLEGGAGRDRLSGLAGDDVLEGGAGRDRLDGGDGIDRATYRGEHTQYRISLGPRWLKVRHALAADDEGPRDGRDKLRNIEFLEFDDVTLELGADRAAIKQTLSLLAQGSPDLESLVAGADPSMIAP